MKEALTKTGAGGGVGVGEAVGVSVTVLVGVTVAVGVKVYPHRLRHTCATQLLNAGCRVTSIQRFLGHKELSSTMVCAKAHDQSVAEDYFAAMERVEQRLEIVPKVEEDMEDVKVRVTQIIEKLEPPELCFEERALLLVQLREAFG
ncbi:MAG: site-specific integrase [Chloroflexi bacterium]|nr:site-specific integrase [Chloroflexota bacterium]